MEPEGPRNNENKDLRIPLGGSRGGSIQWVKGPEED